MLKFPGPPPSLPGSASFNNALPATPAPAVEVPAFEENGTPVEADPNALRIVFSNRGYTEFPKRIIDTNGVVSIIAGGNELSELPPTLALKTGLTRLDFPNNQFKEIPMVVFELPNLKHLDFSKNKISLLPAGITSVCSLTTLLLQGNRLKVFPNHLCVLNRLEQLDMSGNKFKTLPPQLGNMSSLTSLRLSQCELESLPIEIGRLSQLKQLELHHNGLSKLPAEMAALTSLQTLDLGYNLFSTTPVNLFYVDSLTDLNLEKNQLEKIDESILRLSKLTRLNVEYNQLHSLPAEISMLPVLSQLLVIGNPLTNIPLEYQQSGDAVLEHLRWLKLQSSWKRRKLVFVGEEFVGKTSLRMSLINSYSTKTTRRKRKNRGTQLQASATGGTSSPAEIADPVATDGIDIEDWEPLGTDEDGLEPIVFSTWDFAGQQIYHPTHQFFITNRSTYLIIFNLLDQRTSRIEYWLKTLKARTDGKCPVVIVGTHRDDKRCDGKYVDSMFASMRRKYSTRFPFVREYVAVSSKTGRGLDKLTEVLVDLARASRSFKNIPDSYAKLEKQILQIRTTANTMSISEFEGVAISAGVEKADVPSCVGFLHDVGLVLYFNDKTGGLSDLVILDPLWIVNLLSSIITLKHGFVKDGIMMANCLPQIWKEYPPSEYNWLLKLLDKFEIIFRISPSTNADPSQGVRDRWISMLMDDGQSQLEQAAGRRATLASLDLLVIPSMLPATPADSHLNELWNKHSEFESHVYGRRYIFQFLPLGFFSRLIVRSLHMAGLTPQYVWRDGMIIDSDNERALVVHNELDYLLDIVIKTKKRQRSPSVSFSSESAAKKIMAASFNVLRQLADCVETLLVSWFKLKPIVQVPCHHCLYEKLFESPETVPYYFPIEECMLAVREGKDSLTCHAERKSRKRPPTSLTSLNAPKQKDSIGSADSSSLPSFPIPPLSAREMGQASGSSVALSVLELGEHHTCLMRDLCSDIAFSDVSDMTVNWEDLNVGEVIGEGSYAQLRTGSYNNEPVAVKVLKYQQSNGGGSEQMDLLSDSFRELQHETFVMKNLKNPFLVELKAICTLPLAMVVDYFPLGSLDRHLRDTSVTHPCLSWKYRVRLALNIAKGMDYLHSEDFIHRDLRSPNILIASRDERLDIVAKVADFGLAVICAKELKGGDFNECWTAPEILAASAYNSKVDQYSFGIVMWELLELGHPFKEYEEEFGNLPRLDFFDAIIGGLRPSFPETCPQDYQNLVKSCWATDPEDRPSFGRIAETLEAMEPQAAQWDEGVLSATSAPSTPSTIRAILRKKSKGSNLNMRLRQGSLMDIAAPAANSEASSEGK
jgi:Leucine-rich repeat (LRR) protein/serine/threonine protein kinase/GTPase SAR1 family protein